MGTWGNLGKTRFELGWEKSGVLEHKSVKIEEKLLYGRPIGIY